MKPLLSIVTPAFNEAGCLTEFHRRLSAALADVEWEWIVVDDHSTDDTFAVLAQLSKADARVRGVRLARNFGSHAAIACGLAQARGDAAVVLPADLQDPPELARELLAPWRDGAQIVWAVRSGPPLDQGIADRAMSWLYHFGMRRVAGLRELPPPAADAFLIDHALIAMLKQCGETHTNVFVLVAWIGGRQASVSYEKQARFSGRSGWTLTKKIELLIDSVTAFSYAPLRAMSALGLLTALAGFIYAVVVAANALAGRPPAGWSSLMVVLLVVGGCQMLMLGILGEYIGRALREARRRPRYLVQETTSPIESKTKT
jgi:polyisoprenyl-phosphate glycosyltransferase